MDSATTSTSGRTPTTRATCARSWRSSAAGGTDGAGRDGRIEEEGIQRRMSHSTQSLAWQAAVDRRYRAARPRSEALALRARGLLARRRDARRVDRPAVRAGLRARRTARS